MECYRLPDGPITFNSPTELCSPITGMNDIQYHTLENAYGTRRISGENTRQNIRGSLPVYSTNTSPAQTLSKQIFANMVNPNVPQSVFYTKHIPADITNPNFSQDTLHHFSLYVLANPRHTVVLRIRQRASQSAQRPVCCKVT
jgi:hypothetical protein